MKNILDVSSIVCGSHYGSPDKRIQGFPVAGIRKVLGLINANYMQGDVVLCFDGGATLKKELLPTYKAGRVPDYSIMAQIDLLKSLLLECNIPFYQEDGYEADDFVCSMVHLLGLTKDDDGIEIITDDHDLACCVSDNVCIRNVTSNGVYIDRDNYSSRVVSGDTVPYNTILLHKVVNGDKSDAYPALHLPGVSFSILVEHFNNVLNPLFENGSLPRVSVMDFQLYEAVINSLPEQFTAETKKKLVDRGRIVYPFIKDVTSGGQDKFFEDMSSSGDPAYVVEYRHLKYVSKRNMDVKKFNFYCTFFGLNKCRVERQREMYGEMYDSFVNRLQNLAKDLSNGTMAVKYSRLNRRPKTPVENLDNMQLPL